MKKFLIVTAIAAAIACNDAQEKDTISSVGPTSSDSAKTADVTYPYTPTYSAKFEIGDTKHVQTILSLWKDWDNGDLTKGKDYFADSVEMHFADGSVLKGSRDSIIAISQRFRSTLGTVSSTLHTVLPARSTDKNEDWVLVWGTEKITGKNGKIDSTSLQETWRFNKDGKVDFLLQYAAKTTPPKQ